MWQMVGIAHPCTKLVCYTMTEIAFFMWRHESHQSISKSLQAVQEEW